MVAPELLSKINERRALEHIQQSGPSSRAGMAKACGMSAPTASKAVSSLIRHGLLEESGVIEAAFGRPGKLLRLAPQTANVLGVVIDAGSCWVGSARLDGEISDGSARAFPTPENYDELLFAIEQRVAEVAGVVQGTENHDQIRLKYRGMGVSVPGLLNSHLGQTVMSPNLHFLDGRRVGADLAKRFGLKCVVLQESHALCIGERMYGAARGMDNFAMLDVTTGLGLGVVSGGRLLAGNSGMAGEFGHITVDARGISCGCGNRGCLETVATDSAFARLISEILGRQTDIGEAIELVQAGRVNGATAIERTCEHLAIAIAAAINVFNPSTLFVHGRLLASDQSIFERVLAEAKQRTLSPSFADCRILQAKGNKRLGAIAGIIQNLADAWAPSWSALDNRETRRVVGFSDSQRSLRKSP